jgi:hypothetical protein
LMLAGLVDWPSHSMWLPCLELMWEGLLGWPSQLS